jgi:MFS transporter, ACS family, hexuronate transporter
MTFKGTRSDRSPASESAAYAPIGPIGQYRWVICSLIFLATTVNYVDRQILALIKEFLDKELGWSN